MSLRTKIIKRCRLLNVKCLYPSPHRTFQLSCGLSFGAGTDVTSNGSSSAWMMVRGCTENSFAIQDALQQDPLTLAVSNPPRSQRRWLVDGLWLENVRKVFFILKLVSLLPWLQHDGKLR